MMEAPLSSDDMQELATFLENQLLESHTPRETDELRLRLTRLYMGALQDPERAAAHAEQLLERDEVGAETLELTTGLLSQPPVPPRVAELLSSAFARLGRVDQEAATLSVELGVAPPPRSDYVRRRLAELRYREQGDPASALELIEPLVLKEPGDDEQRKLYVEIATALGSQLGAAETLVRAIKRSKVNDVRERVGLDAAMLYLQEGELKHARAALLDVVLVDGGGPAALTAARRLLDLESGTGDPQVIGTALETIARTSDDPKDREDAGERLLLLNESKPLKESRLAAAFQALVDSPRAEDALAWLSAYYEKRGDKRGLSGVYRRQALRAEDAGEARSLAILSIELSGGEGEGDHAEQASSASIGSAGSLTDQWLWLVDQFGPDPRSLGELIPRLEGANRWPDLARVLAASVDIAPPGERAGRWARLGTVRLAQLGDALGALAAFQRCLALDPSNELALRAVEGLLVAGDHRLAAADALEPIYAKSNFDEGQVRILEARAELLPDPKSGLRAYAAAVDLALVRLNDPERGMDLCVRALGQALAFASEAVPDWVAQFERVAIAAKQPDMHAALLVGLLGDGPIQSFERVAIALSAIESLRSSGAGERALALCRRALESDPSSPELMHRLDALLGERDDAKARLARYETALEKAGTAGRRASLRRIVAAIKRDELDDLEGAMDAWREILVEDPADFGAYEALIDAKAGAGDVEGAVDLMERASRVLQGADRSRMALRKALTLAKGGEGVRALEQCRALVEDPGLRQSDLRSIAQIANDEDDTALQRRALELIAASGEPAIRRQAAEELGDLLGGKLGDPAAAVDWWATAARMYGESAADRDQVRTLLERVLEAQPNHVEAAEGLIEVYADAGDWAKIPEALRVLIEGGSDLGRCVRLLLRLEESAKASRAIDDFVALVDELASRFGPESPDEARSLARVRARALGAGDRPGDASKAYRALVETFGNQEDVREFESFIDSRGAADERHQDRRWVYRWKSEHSPHPVDVLVEWARAEEEYGAPDAALAVYERLAQTEGGRGLALEALCRLKLQGGDVAGGIAAFRALRETREPQDRLALDLWAARLLFSELGRPVEAAMVLAPALATLPVVDEALELFTQMLADPASSAEVAERVEQVASTTDHASGLRILRFLAANGSASRTQDARLRLFERIVDLAGADPEGALSAVLEAAEERPESGALWDGAERIAGRLAHPLVVVDAYRRAILAQADAALAEELGRRLVRFQEDRGIESSHTIEALLRVLDLCPGARWALDRVKLVLGPQGRWDELFALFDKAVDAASDEVLRGDLLYEAAFAAKDLAGEPGRAIGYLESLHGLRAGDATVEGALERLYEKQNRKAELIGLLSARIAQASGFKRRDLRRRIATLWLDLEEIDQAGAVVEQMLEQDAFVADVVDLLERIVEHAPPAAPPPKRRGARQVPVQDRAIGLLRAHYEGLERIEEVVRIARRSLTLARDADQRGKCVRDLVALRLRAAAAGPDVFARVIPQMESDVGDDGRLARIAYKALLVRAARQLKRAPSRDVEDGAYTAIRGLGSLLSSPDAAEAAFCLLYRGSRLPIDRDRRRELLCEAAFVSSERLADAARAIRVFEELFRDDAGDEYAAKSFPHLAQLLEATGQHAKLAGRWEEQAQLRAKAGSAAEERACWERAAQLWEGQASWDKAIAAHEHGASLGSVTSHEALARIHADQGAWDEAAKALEWLYAHASVEERGARALRLSEAYVELGRRDRARASLEDALQSATDATEGTDLVREELIALYRRDDVHRPLARLLSSEGRRVSDPERRLQLLCEAADLYQHKLDERGEAATLRELAVQVRPEDGSLRATLVDLLEELGRWDHAAAVLTEQVVLFGEQRSRERAAIHLRLARALERANRSEQALAELRLAVEMHPAHPGILHDLARIALELGQLDLSERTYRALLLVLHRPVEDVKVALPPRADVFLDLAEIAVRNGDSTRAADLVDSGFDEATEHGEDLGRLETGLRTRGRHDLLYRALERRVERGVTLTERAVALGDLAGLWIDHLGRSPELARGIEQHAERIVRDLDHEELTDVSAWMAVANVYAALSPEGGAEASARLARLLETAIPKVRPGADRSLLRVTVAKSLLTEEARVDAAVAVLSSALAEDPAAHEATELLSAVLERHGRIDELIASLKKQLGSLPPEASPHDFAELSLRLGRAFERGNRAPDATTVYETLLDRRPIDPDSLGELSTRLEQVGSARLADCLEEWISAQGSVAPNLARRLVALRDGQGDVGGAVRALEAGFAAEPATTDLRDRLVRHYEEQGDWPQVVRVLARAVEAGRDDRPLLRRLVEAFRRAGDDRSAIEALDAAMTTQAGDAELLGLRAGARERSSDDDGAISDLEAASALDARYLTTLLELLGRVASRSDPQRADACSLRLVDTLIRLNRPKQARRELERVLARNPGHVDALGRVAALTAAEGNWEAAAEAYRKLLPTVQRGNSREELARIAVATAEACAKGGGLEEAREALERAVDTLSSAPELTGELERVCRAMRDWARLGDLLLDRAGRETDSEKKRELLLRAGQFLLEDPAGLAKALGVIEQCRADNPESLDVLLLWSRAQAASGLAHKALAVLYDAADRNRGKRSAALANIYLEIAKAHLSVDEVVEAYEALEFGFGVDWRVGDIAMLLGLVALDLDEHKTADRAFSAVTTLPPRKDASGPGTDAATKAVAFYHLASLALAKGDVAKARRLASKAVGGDPAHQGARALLDRLNGQAAASAAPGK